MHSLYDFSAHSIDGREHRLSEYAGQVVLVVNVASHCGFTPQYAGLEALYQEWRGRGFVVLGFPCNQFGAQEPGTAAQIQQFCTTRYGVSFPLYAKVEVNGVHAHPLWQWLKKQKPGLLGSSAIKWNFTKFLIGRNGKVLARYAPIDTPKAMRSSIESALAQDAA